MRKHYAIKIKARIFRYFDDGKRPSDIDEESLTRKTLYQYYAEWRRENGIKGKATGFALKPFIRRTTSNRQKQSSNTGESTSQQHIVAREENQDISSERKILDDFILDCITIIDALKNQRPGLLFLAGSKNKRYLTDILRIKERGSEKMLFLTFDQYFELFSRWIDIARKAKDREEFYRICVTEGIIYEAPGL